jgi:pimeloyl-ACP methyl ester carboxylesterase
MLAEAGFRALAIQPRGMGKSTGPNDNRPSMEDYTDEVAAVIRAEGQGKIVVAGHAFGSFVARYTGTRHEDLVRGVAVIAGSPGQALDGSSTMGAPAMSVLNECSNLSLPDEKRLAYLYECFFHRDNDARVWLGGWYPDIKIVQRDAAKTMPLGACFPAGQYPVLDIQPADDTLALPEHFHVIKAKFPTRVSAVVVQRAGHALVPEQPRAVADALIWWMRQLP